MAEKKLIITGCGIKSLSHLTRENEAAIKQADLVLYLVNEPIIEQWLRNISNKNESLELLYFSEELRANAYKKIINHIFLAMHQHNNVCVVVYGHPLLLSNSIEYLIKKIDKNLIDLYILPAISAFDCLLTDLEIDPVNGCFSIEATELINKDKYIDPTNHLIIWQIGLINNKQISEKNSGINDIKALKNKLLKTYNTEHECILYEASIYPHLPYKKIKAVVSSLDQISISRITTAYLPPIMPNL